MTGRVSRKRHIAKSITWRVVASLTTFVMALLVFREDVHAVEKAGWVAAFEAVAKMFLYYFHERAWYRTSWGVQRID